MILSIGIFCAESRGFKREGATSRNALTSMTRLVGLTADTTLYVPVETIALVSSWGIRNEFTNSGAESDRIVGRTSTNILSTTQVLLPREGRRELRSNSDEGVFKVVTTVSLKGSGLTFLCVVPRGRKFPLAIVMCVCMLGDHQE